MRKATPDARYRCQKRQLEVTQTPAGCRWHGRSTMPSLTCMWQPREYLSISFVFLEGRVRFMLLNLHSNNIVLKHLIYTSSLSPSLSMYIHTHTQTCMCKCHAHMCEYIHVCIYIYIWKTLMTSLWFETRGPDQRFLMLEQWREGTHTAQPF